jgi:hypothetical protein
MKDRLDTVQDPLFLVRHHHSCSLLFLEDSRGAPAPFLTSVRWSFAMHLAWQDVLIMPEALTHGVLPWLPTDRARYAMLMTVLLRE